MRAVIALASSLSLIASYHTRTAPERGRVIVDEGQSKVNRTMEGITMANLNQLIKDSAWLGKTASPAGVFMAWVKLGKQGKWQDFKATNMGKTNAYICTLQGLMGKAQPVQVKPTQKATPAPAPVVADNRQIAYANVLASVKQEVSTYERMLELRLRKFVKAEVKAQLANLR